MIYTDLPSHRISVYCYRRYLWFESHNINLKFTYWTSRIRWCGRGRRSRLHLNIDEAACSTSFNNHALLPMPKQIKWLNAKQYLPWHIEGKTHNDMSLHTQINLLCIIHLDLKYFLRNYRKNLECTTHWRDAQSILIGLWCDYTSPRLRSCKFTYEIINLWV